jgi:chemotaxis protein MotC
MKRNLLAVSVMGALLLAPLPATAQDPWDDVRALDAALAPPDAAAPAVRMVAPASAAPRSAAVPKPVPRPMPRPAIPAAVPAAVPAAARAPAPDAMPAPTPVAAPASARPVAVPVSVPVAVPVAVPLPPARPALAPAAAPLAVVATSQVPPPPLETAVPADETVPELADLPWLVDVPETAPVLPQTSVAPTSVAQTSAAQAPIAQASVVRTSVAQDTFAPEAFAPETFAPKAFVPQAVAAQAPGMQAHAIQALASQALASQTVASPPLASHPLATPPLASHPLATPPTAVQAVAAAAPSAPAEPPTELRPSQPVAGALSLLSVPVVSIFPPAQAAEEAVPGEAREEPVEPAATDAPAAGDAAPQEASQEAEQETAKEAPQEGPVLPPAPPLYREVRELQRLQDSMAVGVPGALPAQNALIAHIDQLYRAADASVWNDPQNARALVIFALSGGGPGVLRAVLGKSAVPNIDERLLRGSLAYLEGREPEALKQLGEVDMRSLPDSLAGQVALAQAALWVRRDPARAAVLLGRARLIAPGTLVEEAALRRAIFIAAQADDLGTFERMTATYLARFRHSVYAGNFRQRFAAALTRMSFIDKPDEFDRINDLLAPLEPAGRREVALLVAQAAVSQGKTTAAERAAELVLKGAVFGSLEADRATLYRAAATITSPERFAEAQTELASVASERFAPDDARLLAAAQTVAASILHAVDIPPPEEGGGAAPAADPAAADPAGTDSPAVADTGPPPATLAKAQAALASVDQLLGDAPL